MNSQKITAPIRVAAYIRVSTDKEIQQKSFLTQTAHFHRLIHENPKWQEAGIYLDYAVSGTGREPRIGFERMMAHCRQGKINRIITKSVSRFSRNSADLLETLQFLKQRNVSVYFENENLDTGRGEDQFVISVMGAAAEQEARNISENLRWSIRKKFESGNACFHRIYGYKTEKVQAENGERGVRIAVCEKEAQVIRLIFQRAVQGMSCTEIARMLNQENVPEPPGGRKFSEIREKRKCEMDGSADRNQSGETLKTDGTAGRETAGWMMHHIIAVLSNERYTGDALCQKSYTVEGTWKHSRCNHGEKMSYYIPAHHPAIISREQFLRAGKESKAKEMIGRMVKTEMCETEETAKAGGGEIAKEEQRAEGQRIEESIIIEETHAEGRKLLRASGKIQRKYPFTRRILCPHCGCYYNRCSNTSRNPDNVLWCCYSRLRQVNRFRCTAPKYRTAYLERAVAWMFYERFFAGRQKEDPSRALHRLAACYRKEAFWENYEEDRLYYWCRSQMGNPSEAEESLKKLEQLDRDWKAISEDLETRMEVLDRMEQLEKEGAKRTGFLQWFVRESVQKYLSGWVLRIIPYAQDHIRVRWFDGKDTERFFAEREMELLGQGLLENIQ